MTPVCNLCLKTGIKTVLVSLMAQKAEVKFDPAYIMPSQIANRITEMGFNTTVLESETAGQGVVELQVMHQQGQSLASGARCLCTWS